MNILYIDHYAGSLRMGMEFRPYYFAREWQKMGHKVRIVGASFSHLRKENPTVDKDFEIQKIDGVEFQWVKTGSYEGNGVKRALTLFEFCTKLSMRAAELAREFRPDVVISSSTYPLDTYPAQKIRKLASNGTHHCRYIHEAHDLWPLTLIELAGWSEKHPFIRMLAAAEHSALSKADHVVAVTAHELDYMLKHGLKGSERFTHIPNGVVVEDWAIPEELDDPHSACMKELHRKGKMIICYLGGHAMSNALDTLLDAAKLTNSNEGFAFVCVGSGTEKARLEKRKANEQIENLVFLPPVSKKQVPSLLAEADMLYIGAMPCSLYRFGVSMNKVYDYMMAGKPIIYGVEAANNDVQEAGCGLSIPANDAQAVVDAAEQLCAMSPEQRREMGEKGRTWVTKNCDYQYLSELFIGCM